MQYLRFKILGDLVKHGISMRQGGVSEGYLASLNLGLDVGDKEVNLRENYTRFCMAVGVPMEHLVLAMQEHSDCVINASKGGGFLNPLSGVDGFITSTPRLPLMVRFADCQGVLMFDPVRRVIAAVHCGWRGNVQNIIGKAINQMVSEFDCDAADILVGISPSLGPCCGEFSDPANELPEFMQKYVTGRRVDLWQCSFDQLAEAGVLPKHTEIARRCTVCENDQFFSYRGGKKQTGHMGGVIML